MNSRIIKAKQLMVTPNLKKQVFPKNELATIGLYSNYFLVDRTNDYTRNVRGFWVD